MKTLYLSLILLFFPMLIIGQQVDSVKTSPQSQHYISVNPLNISLFQQIGLSYEYRIKQLGFGITAGYIYPNKKAYSNYFIAGPTSYGSLGYYSGLFVVPQFNFYLTKIKSPHYSNQIYISLKGVYKYMQIDSTDFRAWDTHDKDSYWIFRRQFDKVNIYGGFIDFGYKLILQHFFLDINIGPGIMSVNHNMVIAQEKSSLSIKTFNPPKLESNNGLSMTINFALNLGITF